MDGWTDQDAAAARMQGWALVEVWDMDKERLEVAVAGIEGGLTDMQARTRVMVGTGTSDSVAIKAMKLVMTSKINNAVRRKKK